MQRPKGKVHMDLKVLSGSVTLAGNSYCKISSKGFLTWDELSNLAALSVFQGVVVKVRICYEQWALIGVRVLIQNTGK